jgi:hypothetical protein
MQGAGKSNPLRRLWRAKRHDPEPRTGLRLLQQLLGFQRSKTWEKENPHANTSYMVVQWVLLNE